MTAQQVQMIKSSDKAFTLSELMIATAILLIAILGLLTAYINSMLLNETNRNLVTAANDAQYVLEQIKALAYDAIDDYTPPVFQNLNNEIITLTRSSFGIGTKIGEVTVNVSWNERGRNKIFQLSTRIAR